MEYPSIEDSVATLLKNFVYLTLVAKINACAVLYCMVHLYTALRLDPNERR
jgi:hypothetical protein